MFLILGMIIRSWVPHPHALKTYAHKKSWSVKNGPFWCNAVVYSIPVLKGQQNFVMFCQAFKIYCAFRIVLAGSNGEQLYKENFLLYRIFKIHSLHSFNSYNKLITPLTFTWHWFSVLYFQQLPPFGIESKTYKFQ